ncbi:hypothetical protein JCM11491_002723 [Sporobolomyces phaffii]
MLSRLLPTLLRPVPTPARLAVLDPHLARSLRAMSTAATEPNTSVWSEKLPRPEAEMATFLCVVPDLPDSKRMSVRPQHLQDAAVGHANGWIVKAGATFSDDSRSTMTGSWFLLREESSDKARARLSKDIYVTGGAWDMDKATITPVAVAKH